MFACAALLLVLGCRDGIPIVIDTANWSQPATVSHSRDSLATDFNLQKWNNTLVAFNEDGRGFTTYMFREKDMCWEPIGATQPNMLPLDCSPCENRFVVSRATATQHELQLRFILGTIAEAGVLSRDVGASLSETTKSLFKPGNDLIFANATRPLELRFNRSVIRGSNVYVPYSIEAQPVIAKGQRPGKSRYANGIFYSANSGVTWTIIKISDSFSILPAACATEAHNYYFAADYDHKELWCSRADTSSLSWSAPEALSEKLAIAGYRHVYEAAATGDIVHVCWLDSRHERTRANPVYPDRGNYQVAYRHRKDADQSWSKDVILSPGVLYAYSPSIAAEGDNIVAAWAGANDRDGHDEFWPNDIYVVTSRNGGNTWTKPMKVTNGFKDGITSGRPQVALHKGVIHLFYIQGKIKYKEVSAGMALLNQPPWPIYYTQRPFPK